MVKKYVIALLLISVVLTDAQISFGQKLTIAPQIGYPAGMSYKMQFGNQPFQFLYAAPYAPGSTSIYNQVRIAKIHGVSSDISEPEKAVVPNNFGARIEYHWKNNFRARFGFTVEYRKKNVFYSFQNLFIDLNEAEQDLDYYLYNTDNDPSLDDHVSISNWFNNFEIGGDYFFKTKTKFKFFVGASYSFRVGFLSKYTSKTVKDKEAYESGDKTKYYEEYLNTVVFQDRIYQEFKSDGINHLFNLNVGIVTSNYLELGYRFGMGFSAKDSPYYENMMMGAVYLRIRSLNIALFK